MDAMAHPESAGLQDQQENVDRQEKKESPVTEGSKEKPGPQASADPQANAASVASKDCPESAEPTVESVRRDLLG